MYIIFLNFESKVLYYVVSLYLIKLLVTGRMVVANCHKCKAAGNTSLKHPASLLSTRREKRKSTIDSVRVGVHMITRNPKTTVS